MSIVVTGSTGQVGLHLVEALVARGHRVRAVTMPGDRTLRDRRDVEVVEADVRDAASLNRAFLDADTVYHLAAVVSTKTTDDPVLWAVNATGAANAARSAREAGVRKFVHFSSMVVFDPDPRDRPLDEERRRVCGEAHAPYSRSKVLGERLVRREVDAGLDAVVVHPTVVVGPHENHHAGIVRNLIAPGMAGKLPAVIEGGFNLVDVDDVVTGAIAAAERGRTGESYILSGRWYSVRHFAGLCASMSGRRRPVVQLPMWLAKGALPYVELAARLVGMRAPFNAEELNQLAGNPSIQCGKAERELDYRPRAIDGALDRVKAWLESGAPRPAHSQ